MTERKETSLTRLASAVMTSESVKEGADRLLRFTRSLSTCTELEQCEWVGCLELNLREAGFLTDIALRKRNQWCIAPANEAPAAIWHAISEERRKPVRACPGKHGSSIDFILRRANRYTHAVK